MVEITPSVIDRAMTIVGEITCAGRVFVKGKIHGSFSGGTVIIGESGTIKGKISANEIECWGQIEGNAVTDKFVMRKSGCHLGTVETKLLEVDPGAHIDCLLQSGFSQISDLSCTRVDLNGLCSIFDDKGMYCAMDVPWSERKELFDQIVSLLQKGKQLIKVIGEKGSGKTTLVRVLVERLAADKKVVVIREPVGSVKDLLLTLATDLGAISDERETPKEIVQRIRAAVSEAPGGKPGIVLAIDDAHLMYPATIEGIIRCLTSACGGEEELLQLILLGLGELDRKLVHTAREYFEDETNCLLALEPLTIKDTAEYLRFCIQRASDTDARITMSLLPYETIRQLHTRSKGNIAEINRLAGNTLRITL